MRWWAERSWAWHRSTDTVAALFTGSAVGTTARSGTHGRPGGAGSRSCRGAACTLWRAAQLSSAALQPSCVQAAVSCAHAPPPPFYQPAKRRPATIELTNGGHGCAGCALAGHGGPHGTAWQPAGQQQSRQSAWQARSARLGRSFRATQQLRMRRRRQRHAHTQACTALLQLPALPAAGGLTSRRLWPFSTWCLHLMLRPATGCHGAGGTGVARSASRLWSRREPQGSSIARKRLINTIERAGAGRGRPRHGPRLLVAPSRSQTARRPLSSTSCSAKPSSPCTAGAMTTRRPTSSKPPTERSDGAMASVGQAVCTTGWLPSTASSDVQRQIERLVENDGDNAFYAPAFQPPWDGDQGPPPTSVPLRAASELSAAPELGHVARVLGRQSARLG